MNKNLTLRLGIIIIGLYMVVTTMQGIGELWKAEDKMTSREKTLANLIKQRDDLLRRKNEVESKDYLEKMAYDKLGMTRPGEQVVIVPQDLLTDSSRTIEAGGEANWKKWWRLIF